jgi:hypothetical protein
MGGSKMKKEYNIDGETMKWIKSMDNGVRGWVKDTPDHIREIIESGDAFFFQYSGRDYFIERGSNGFLIQDPQIGHMEDTYVDYPGHEEAKTPEELVALQFLEGKTIFERFDELRFFDY